jgi:hypothetical protein
MGGERKDENSRKQRTKRKQEDRPRQLSVVETTVAPGREAISDGFGGDLCPEYPRFQVLQLSIEDYLESRGLHRLRESSREGDFSLPV